jgi:glycine/D-amino acid oxidase-like deaminating enzyme
MSAWTPLWQDYRYDARARLEDDLDVDVAIIGAGIGGISTAWHLAARGIRATVLEARTAGSGASGRNGGFLIAGTAPFHNDARRRMGHDLARRIHAATIDAQTEVLEIAGSLGAGGLFERRGSLRLAVDAEESAHLLEDVEALHEDGFPAELVTGDDLPAELRGPGRSGYVVPEDCSVQPSRWIRAFAEGAEERGARILEHTPVAAPLGERDGTALVLRTPHGRVRAERVVVASDGALPVLAPAFAPFVRTKRLHMVATAPTDAVLAQQLVYSRWGYEYHHQTPEGRVALGGYSDVDADGSFTEREEPTPVVLERLAAHLRDELGVRAPITHRWVGLVGYGPQERPFAGAVPGEESLYVLGGYNGTGNLNGFVAGRIVAGLIADGDAPDADLFDTGRIAGATSSRPSSTP